MRRLVVVFFVLLFALAIVLLVVFLKPSPAAAADKGRVALEPIVGFAHAGDIEVESELFGWGGQRLSVLRENLDAVDWSLFGGLRAIVPVSDRVDLRGVFSVGRSWGETTYPLEGVYGAGERVRTWRTDQAGQVSVRVWLGAPRGARAAPALESKSPGE